MVQHQRVEVPRVALLGMKNRDIEKQMKNIFSATPLLVFHILLFITLKCLLVFT